LHRVPEVTRAAEGSTPHGRARPGHDGGGHSLRRTVWYRAPKVLVPALAPSPSRKGRGKQAMPRRLLYRRGGMRSSRRSWPTLTMTMAVMIGANARQNNAILLLPVASFTSPYIHGPSHPPRLPSELIMAMPPAAAVPVRRALGVD